MKNFQPKKKYFFAIIIPVLVLVGLIVYSFLPDSQGLPTLFTVSSSEQTAVSPEVSTPEPTATPDPKTVDPDAVTSNGNLTMVNEYLAENGSEALGMDGVTPTPAASDGSTDTDGEATASGEDTDTIDAGGEEGVVDGE